MVAMVALAGEAMVEVGAAEEGSAEAAGADTHASASSATAWRVNTPVADWAAWAAAAAVPAAR